MSSPPTYPGTPTFSIAGSLNTGNTVTLDGAMHNDVASNTALPLPFPDALQEFKVETSSLPAVTRLTQADNGTIFSDYNPPDPWDKRRKPREAIL